jgi:hypothetical protein
MIIFLVTWCKGEKNWRRIFGQQKERFIVAFNMLRRLAALSVRASNCPFFCNFGRLLAATLIDRRDNIVFY